MDSFISDGSMSRIQSIEPPKAGKREHKRASTKLQIMETFIEAMKTDPLDSLRVEDLCKDIGISKVTFFNYFSSKEQIIEYFIYKWQFDLCHRLQSGELSGVEGLKAVYHSVAEHEGGANIMATLMQFYLSHQDFERMVLSPYELYLFNEEAYMAGTPFLDLPDIFAEILKTVDIPKEKIRPTVLNLVSGFYGVSFVMRIASPAQGKEAQVALKKAFDRFVDSTLWGVK